MTPFSWKAFSFPIVWVTVLWCLLSAYEGRAASAAVLSLRGYLSAEATHKAIQEIDRLRGEEHPIWVIEVRSSSGDLQGVLEVAKQLYELRRSKALHFVFFIDDLAVGPAAILPFLADELYISPVASWGDVPTGADGTMPVNLLRSRVRSLILENHPKASLLHLLADAMVDPSVVIVDDHGWKEASKEEAQHLTVVSPGGETLVLNQSQLQELGLVSAVLPLESFERQFGLVATPAPVAAEKEESTGVEERLKRAIPYSETEPNRVGWISIDDRSSGINQATWIYVKSALDYYKAHKPICLILRLDTPGGEVFAAQRISDALKEMDTQYHVPVIAFIDNWAISAGAMLAYSCRFIATVKDGSMGAAEPVFSGEGGEMKEAPEKVNSALRADFGNRARFFDRDPLLAQAMVDKDILLVWRHGKVVKLNSEAEIRSGGLDPDTILSAKGKLLTLTAAEMMKYGVADLLLPPTQLEPITDAERTKGQWPADKLLLWQQPFFKSIPNATVDAYSMDWRTLFLSFLSQPMVTSLLFMGMLLGFYLELNAPGHGVSAGLGLVCLLLLLLSSFALEAVGWLEVILMAMGVLLLVIDFFLLPTFGILGSLGALFLFAGLIGLLLPGVGSVSFDLDSGTLNAAGEAVLQRMGWLALSILAAALIIGFLARWITPRSRLLHRFVSQGEQNHDLGYVAGPLPGSLPKVQDRGVAFSTLRPSGKVRMGGQIFDAVSDGAFIDKGAFVVVVEIEGNRLVVREEKSQARG